MLPDGCWGTSSFVKRMLKKPARQALPAEYNVR